MLLFIYFTDHKFIVGVYILKNCFIAVLFHDTVLALQWAGSDLLIGVLR